jgi:hypothetical protein
MDVLLEGLRKRIESILTDEQKKTYESPTDLESLTMYSAHSLNLTIADIMAMPEDDRWFYETNDSQQVFAPSTFVAAALQAYGVFHGEKINASEFTVKDIYQLDIYDTKFERPEFCKEADYLLHYC